jgi:hypothetical protein
MRKEKRKNKTHDSILQDESQKDKNKQEKIREIGGVEGPEPTRFGDWEKQGRCIDF